MQCFSKDCTMRFYHLLLALIYSTISMAAWSPIIRQFSPQDYAAGTQNWDIVEHTNGWIYVANNYGLLETDGTQWQLYGIHNENKYGQKEYNRTYSYFLGFYGLYVVDSPIGRRIGSTACYA